MAGCTLGRFSLRSGSVAAQVVVAVLAIFGLAGCGGGKATLATFAGGWTGHAHDLAISQTGTAKEWASLGLGSNWAITLRFHLTRPTGTPHDATATATVTAVRFGKRSASDPAYPPLRVGKSFRIRLRDGVISEPLTGENYCSPTVKHWVCGA